MNIGKNYSKGKIRKRKYGYTKWQCEHTRAIRESKESQEQTRTVIVLDSKINRKGQWRSVNVGTIEERKTNHTLEVKGVQCAAIIVTDFYSKICPLGW